MKSEKCAFANVVKTDGFAINFTFARKKLSVDNMVNTKLGFREFTNDEVETHFELAALDPGRIHVFTSAFASGNDSQSPKMFKR